MRKVAILGGGVAGLAAAYRLLQLRPDWQVSIFEKENRLGGLAASMRKDDFRADLGPHRIYTELPEIEALLPELISRDKMLTVSRASELLLEGHFYQYPVRAGELLRELGVTRMLKFGFSAIAGKIRGMLFRPRNYEQAMVSAFGRAAYDLLVGPYTQKVWKIEPSQLSEEIARVRVSAGNTNRLLKQLLGRRENKGSQTALGQFTYIRGGVEGLVSSLKDRATGLGAITELESKVSGILLSEGHIVGVELKHGSESRQINADYVISTLPVTELLDFFPPSIATPEVQKAASGLVYVGLILVGLIINRPQFTRNSWIYFPEKKFIFNRAYEPRNFDPSMSPESRTMAVFEVTARWDSDLWGSSDSEIIRKVREDAISTGLVQPDDIADAFAHRVPYTYPLYTSDFTDRLYRVFSALEKIPNLVSTGRQGLFNHNNMDHSMLMGIRAAEYVASEKEVAHRWVSDLDQFSHFRIVD